MSMIQSVMGHSSYDQYPITDRGMSCTVQSFKYSEFEYDVVVVIFR